MTLPSTFTSSCNVLQLDSNAAAVRSGLDRVATFTKRVQHESTNCRLAWLAVGKALLAQKQLTPSTQAYGHWITDNGFDQGLLECSQTRSDLLWMASVWDAHLAELNCSNSLRSIHPCSLRQECRRRNFRWAFADDWWRPRAAEPPHYPDVPTMGLLGSTYSFPAQIAPPPIPHRERVDPDDVEEFDRLVHEAAAAARAKLKAARAEADSAKAAYEAATKLALDGRSGITRKYYQLVASCLHPDKPDRSVERLNEAFKIFARLAWLIDEDS